MIEIKTLSALLENFVPKGVDKIENAIKEHEISHPVTIGTMYEGLTRAVMDMAIFEGLDLNIITNSHIKGTPKEFDVLLIEGKAERIPYTDRYQCMPEQVIAVIQVKKTLYSKDLRDSYNNLKGLIDHYNGKDPEDYMFRLIRDGFRAICRKDITMESKKNYNDQEDAIYSTLCVEAQLPLRIVWGYNGFADEQGVRESFYEYLAENVTTDLENIVGYFGPHNYPSLIICGNSSLLKANGMPYGPPLLSDGSWAFYLSSPKNPSKLLLELLWTRLSYKFPQIPAEIFGEDLEQEQFNLFLDCKIGRLGNKQGWHYHAFSPKKKFFEPILESSPWMPVELDMEQHLAIMQLCEGGEIHIDDSLYFEELLSPDGTYSNRIDFINSLIATGLVYTENNILTLLTDNCECVMMPNGKTYAAENKAGRLTNWVLEQTKKKNRTNN